MAGSWGSSWSSRFITWGGMGSTPAVPDVVYGEPFIDATAEVLTRLGADSLMSQFIGADANVRSAIERTASLPSSRISRSAT